MKLILLTQNLSAQVDDWNYDRLMEHKWRAQYAKGKWYATRSLPRIKGILRKVEWMHRVIMDTPEDMEVDHRDGDGLNNLEENVRNCTPRQNNLNKKASGKSKYLGVSYSNGRIMVQIRGNNSLIYLGYCKTEEQAAKRYDSAAKYFHGVFAHLNFPNK